MRMVTTLLLAAAVVVCALCGGAEAVEITVGPHSCPLSIASARIYWETDVPGDSLVEYGPDGCYVYSTCDATYTTAHDIAIPLYDSDVAYDFRVTSNDGGIEPGVGYGWYYIWPNFAGLVWPEEDEIVHGTVQIKGGPTPASIPVSLAYFEVRSLATGLVVWTGYDSDGTDISYSPYEPSEIGDGWSGYWPTEGMTDGDYTATITLYTALGTYSASHAFRLDATPPFPAFYQPDFSQRCYGIVTLAASGATDASRVEFEEKKAPPIVKFPTTPMKQKDYPYDGDEGNSMCHPTCQASIMWSAIPGLKEKYLNDPRNDGKTPAEKEAKGKALLVKDLAEAKTVTNKGVNDLPGYIGSNVFLWRFDPQRRWGYYSHLIHNAEGLKDFCTNVHPPDPNKEVKGIGLVYTYEDPPGTWHNHTVAIKELDDNPVFFYGKKIYKLIITDPRTGKDEDWYMTDDGKLYRGKFAVATGAQEGQVTGAFQINGPKTKKPQQAMLLLGDEDWQTIGVDSNAADGWSCQWDTTGKEPGHYLLRAEAFESNGNSGEDVTEAIIPLACRAGASRRQPDGTPIDLTGCAVTHVTAEEFWVEDVNRASAIGVLGPGSTVARGDVIQTLSGSLTTVGLERRIAVLSVTTVPGATQAIKPFGMANRWLVGGSLAYDANSGAGQIGGPGAVGPNNIGMLVRMWGRCTGSIVGPDTRTYFIINDGSGWITWPYSGVKVDSPVALTTGDYVAVTGICGLQDWGPSGIVPTIRARDADDVRTYTVPF